MAAKEKIRIADQDEILDFLTKVMRGEVMDQMGFETSVRDRKDAAIQLGKRYAMWIDNQKLSGEVGVKIINDIPRNNKPN
jgi:phage terminase small subunit